MYVFAGLMTKTGQANRDRFGAVVSAVNDFDADGHDDFAVAAPGAGKMYVYSGVNGAMLFARNEAVERLAPMGDVNGDGFADFAAGIPSYRAGSKRLGKIVIFGGPD
ncbi:MAG: FG-GAP repeat domain-containing protein, partial [Vicinamibacterales bacterium]